MPSTESVAGATQHQFTATADDAGQRLDRVVAARLPDLSRTRVQELIEESLILIDGRSAKGAQRLRGGECISLQIRARPPMKAEAESIPLEILYEDGDVVAVNKPAGMTVHAGTGNPRGTLVNALLGRGQALSQGGDALRPGIVHRLDKDTSGVILVAKNDAAHAKLGEEFRRREVKKTYIALVHGSLKPELGRIDFAIGRDPKRRTRMMARRGGKASAGTRGARTDWRTLAHIDSTTLVEVQIHTGRTHQIRVHFSALHHPVVGDELYGAPSQVKVGTGKHATTLPSLERNFLHAAKLGFAQPRTGAWIELRAPFPMLLHEFLHRLAAASGDSAERIDAALSGYL